MTYAIVAFLVLGLLTLSHFIYGFFTPKKLPVLMYHAVSEATISDLTVLQSELEKHFQYLKTQQYETIFCDGIDPNKKQVILTFDDGYINNRELLLPLLVKYNFKATIFLPFQYIGSVDEWWTNSQPIMDAAMLRSLPSEYLQLGWHSYSHSSFRKIDLAQMREDFEKSLSVIKTNQLDVKPYFAYPFGNFPKNKQAMAGLTAIFKDFGIQYAFRIGNKTNKLPLKNQFLVKRIDIKGTDSFSAFRWKLKYGRIKPF